MLKGTYWHQPMSLRIQITFPVHKHSMTRHSNSGLNPCLEAVCRTPAGCVAAFIVISCDAMQVFVPAAELLNLVEADLLFFSGVNWTTAAAFLKLASKLGEVTLAGKLGEMKDLPFAM